MTPGQREILDAMPHGEPVSAAQLAKTISGTQNPTGVGLRLSKLRKDGYVTSTPGRDSRSALWVKIQDATEQPDKHPGTRVVTRTDSTPPMTGGGGPRKVCVRLPLEPWAAK